MGTHQIWAPGKAGEQALRNCPGASDSSTLRALSFPRAPVPSFSLYDVIRRLCLNPIAQSGFELPRITAPSHFSCRSGGCVGANDTTFPAAPLQPSRPARRGRQPVETGGGLLMAVGIMG